ncbi:MAG: hypothetical protein ABIA74_00585 [bacterium]
MKKWSILFLLFFHFLYPKTAIIFINPKKNVNEEILEARSVFCKKIKKQAKRGGDFFDFEYQEFDGTMTLEFKYNVAELFTLLILVKDKYEKINVFCFGFGENIFNFVSHKFNQPNLINGVYVFDKCSEIRPNLAVVEKIYNFYSIKPKIQFLTGKVIYPSFVRNKIININIDTSFGENKEAIFYYKYLGKKLLHLQDQLDEVQDVIQKDKRLILPTSKNGEIQIVYTDVS